MVFSLHISIHDETKNKNTVKRQMAPLKYVISVQEKRKELKDAV